MSSADPPNRDPLATSQHAGAPQTASEVPLVPGFDLATLAREGEWERGEFVDFVEMPGGCLGVVLGEIIGHGSGAFLGQTVRDRLRALGRVHGDPGEVLTRLNRVLAADEVGHSSALVTLFLARLDPGTRTVVYASAAEPAYHLDRAGQAQSLEIGSPPLGIETDEVIESVQLALEPGELLFLFNQEVTDGMGPDHTMFGTARALEILGANRTRSAQEIVEAFYRGVLGFCRRSRPQFSVTIVVVKATGR
jgi:serine phosphatase RsbU (regulator of sigma subunit)